MRHCNAFQHCQILGVEPNAGPKDIKKAYRSKSLEFHPDKNPGNDFAANMFVMVAKAHEALTDEVARANYEKYGNPDGRQSLEVDCCGAR